MLAVFFIGIGASAILSGLAEAPFRIALPPTAVRVFAAIYYPAVSSKTDRRPAWFSQRTRFSAIWVSRSLFLSLFFLPKTQKI